MPTKSPVSRLCSLTEEMPSSVESGSGPSIRGGSQGTTRKRRVEFAIDDGGSDASGWKSKKGDDKIIIMKPCKHELQTERMNEKRVLQAVSLLKARIRKE